MILFAHNVERSYISSIEIEIVTNKIYIMKTLGNDLLALNGVKFESVIEKNKAMNKLSATYMELEGTEKQIDYAKSLVEKTFGENLIKLDRLIEKCEKFKSMPDFPLHKDLEAKLALWESIKNEKKAGKIIETIKN